MPLEQPIDPPASELAAVFASVSIPPRPALLFALQREMNKEDQNVRRIAELINRDAAIAGSLLKTANSACFNLRQRARTVQEVILLIGLNQCAAVMSGLIARRSFGTGAMMMARFWDVSEKRAKAMNWLARETRSVAPELAYIFGLFCDIGIPLMKGAFADYLKTLKVANKTAAGAFLDVENRRHGVNHAVVGEFLVERWSIAPEVVCAVRGHHDRGVLCDDAVAGATRTLVALNLVAEKAIQEYRGEAESLEWRESGDAACEALRLVPDDVEALCEALHNLFRG